MRTSFPTLQEAHIWAQPVAFFFSVIIKGALLQFIHATDGPVANQYSLYKACFVKYALHRSIMLQSLVTL